MLGVRFSSYVAQQPLLSFAGLPWPPVYRLYLRMASIERDGIQRGVDAKKGGSDNDRSLDSVFGRSWSALVSASNSSFFGSLQRRTQQTYERGRRACRWLCRAPTDSSLRSVTLRRVEFHLLLMTFESPALSTPVWGSVWVSVCVSLRMCLCEYAHM